MAQWTSSSPSCVSSLRPSLPTPKTSCIVLTKNKFFFNKEYFLFRYFQQIVKFQSLLNSLSSSFLINPSYSLDIAELVLNLAIHATWSNVPSHLPSQGTTTTLSDVPAEIRLRYALIVQKKKYNGPPLF